MTKNYKRIIYYAYASASNSTIVIAKREYLLGVDN